MEVKTRIEKRYRPVNVEIEYIVTEDGQEFTDTLNALEHERYLQKKKAAMSLPHFEGLDINKKPITYYYIAGKDSLNILLNYLGNNIQLTNNDDFFLPTWYGVESFWDNDIPSGSYFTDMNVMTDWIGTYLRNIETEFNKYVK